MSDSKRQEKDLSELKERSINDAKRFFHPLVADERATVIRAEIDGGYAYITVQSASGKRVTLRYDMRTKRLFGRL
jgi:hypothetical protein